MLGGIETVIESLAHSFHDKGHDVCVLCQVEEDGGGRQFPFCVVRKPRPIQTLRWWKWAQVVIHANVSLRGLWPFVFIKRPWVVTHHGWYYNDTSLKSWNGQLKAWVSGRFASLNISVSHAVADHLGFPCVVIHNPYDESVFRLFPEIHRSRDLLFVGRLVSDKAPECLVHAAAELKKRSIATTITITGGGPEEGRLREQVRSLGLEDAVEFSGAKRGESLARLMNGHRLLVVPSKVKEGFGMVALEAIACGCDVLVADVGGLPEAVGPCGAKYEAGSMDQLVRALEEFLTGKSDCGNDSSGRRAHLSCHTRDVVANNYLAAISSHTKMNEESNLR